MRNLKILREYLGVSQEWISKRVDCSLSSVSNLENLRHVPGFDLAIGIAEALALEAGEQKKPLTRSKILCILADFEPFPVAELAEAADA